METVFIQIKAPRGSDPGRVLEGHHNVVGDTVVLHVERESQWWPTGRPAARLPLTYHFCSSV